MQEWLQEEQRPLGNSKLWNRGWLRTIGSTVVDRVGASSPQAVRKGQGPGTGPQA